MVRWLRWHCPPDTGFEIRALAVWGRARYLSLTEAPHNTDFHTWMGKKQFCFFETAETGNRAPNSGVKGSGANHYPRAPALEGKQHKWLCENNGLKVRAAKCICHLRAISKHILASKPKCGNCLLKSKRLLPSGFEFNVSVTMLCSYKFIV